MNHFVPNTFQTPNFVVDDLMHMVPSTGICAYLFIIRKTIGWGKTRDRISISQFEYVLGKKKSAVLELLKKLEHLGLIKRYQERGRITSYEPVLNPPVPTSPENRTTPENRTSPVPENRTRPVQKTGSDQSRKPDTTKPNNTKPTHQNLMTDDWLETYPKNASDRTLIQSIFDKLQPSEADLKNQTMLYLNRPAVLNEFPRFVKKPEAFLLEVFTPVKPVKTPPRVELTEEQLLVREIVQEGPMELNMEPQFSRLSSRCLSFIEAHRKPVECPFEFLARMRLQYSL